MKNSYNSFLKYKILFIKTVLGISYISPFHPFKRHQSVLLPLPPPPFPSFVPPVPANNQLSATNHPKSNAKLKKSNPGIHIYNPSLKSSRNLTRRVRSIFSIQLPFSIKSSLIPRNGDWMKRNRRLAMMGFGVIWRIWEVSCIVLLRVSWRNFSVTSQKLWGHDDEWWIGIYRYCNFQSLKN